MHQFNMICVSDYITLLLLQKAFHTNFPSSFRSLNGGAILKRLTLHPVSHERPHLHFYINKTFSHRTGEMSSAELSIFLVRSEEEDTKKRAKYRARFLQRAETIITHVLLRNISHNDSFFFLSRKRWVYFYTS